MPMPIVLTLAYLAVNLAILLWLELSRANGHAPSDRVTVLALALRFGPPLIGLGYLVTIAGDWLFFGFVIAFFVIAFFLMDGLLSYATPRRRSEPMRSGWDDRGSARVNQDRDSAT